MKVKLLTLMAGPDGIFPPGSIVDLKAKEAKALIDSRQALPVSSKKETATNTQRETRANVPDDDDDKEA